MDDVGNPTGGALARGNYSAFFGSSGGLSSGDFEFGINPIPYPVPTTLTSPFVFGQTFTASLQVFSIAFISSGPDSQFESLGHAIGFGGIVSVKDANGNAVTFEKGSATSVLLPAIDSLATITSASGIDYLSTASLPAVEILPEPQFLMLSALPAIIFCRMRRPVA